MNKDIDQKIIELAEQIFEMKDVDLFVVDKEKIRTFTRLAGILIALYHQEQMLIHLEKSKNEMS